MMRFNALNRRNSPFFSILTHNSTGSNRKPAALFQTKYFSKSSPTPVLTPKQEGTVFRIRELWGRYGVVGIGTYLTTYVVVLGSIYTGVEYGFIDTSAKNPQEKNSVTPEDQDFNILETTNKFVDLAQKFGVAEWLEVEKINPKTGSFLMAWIITKITEPLRLAFTIAVTPRIARLLGRAPKKIKL